VKWIHAAALFLSGLLVLFCAPAADAASNLAGIRVERSTGGNTLVTLTFAGPPPAGWHVNGIGTRTVTLVLPQTARAATLPALYAGVDAIQSVRVSSAATELDVFISLVDVAQVFSASSANTISVVIGPVARLPAPHAAAARPISQPAASTGAAYEVVPLKYADVSEVVGILVPGQTIAPNDTFQPAASIFTLPTQPGQQAPQQYTAPSAALAQPESIGERINDNVAIDRRLNAVVLSGTPDEVARLKAEIAQIDVPLPGVMLACEVVELTQTAAHDLGLDLTAGSGTPVAGGGGTLASGGLPQFRAEFQANLFATVAHGGGQILATPRVVALNGTSAQILTGDALPIISTTLYPGSPPITQQTVNYIAVGVNLQIQPRITTDGFVTSHIFAEVSSVTAYVPTQQGNVPQISLRQATTSATVADGEPFAIGGLLQSNEIENLSKIPGIGDLPIIGGLFRVRHDMTVKSNLYIIITPHIIKPATR